jgi:siroheme decarboxylase
MPQLSTRPKPNTLNDSQQQALKCAIQEGLPIDSRPYLVLANIIGGTEESVIHCIEEWIKSGLIKRFGLVIKHHNVGYTSNAMVVWNVSDDIVDELGERIKQSGLVTLCYRRPRRLPDWNYNLFCMIHGKNRDQVLGQLETLIESCQLKSVEHDVLFSYKQFKQCGGRYHSMTKASSHG